MGRSKDKIYRRKFRQMLHDQLDAMLNGMTTDVDPETGADGKPMTVFDSMLMRSAVGYGFNVRVHSLSPEETQQHREAPATVDPARLKLERDEPFSGEVDG